MSDYTLPYLGFLGNTSSFRFKFYPQQDIISFIGNHQVRIANVADLTYSLGGKFRVNNLLDQNFSKVFEKNHSFVQLNIPEPGFGLKNLSSTISCKNQYNKIHLENSVYFNLNRIFKDSKLKFGLYSRNKMVLDNGSLKLGDLK